jgi:hypothetical protein
VVSRNKNDVRMGNSQCIGCLQNELRGKLGLAGLCLVCKVSWKDEIVGGYSLAPNEIDKRPLVIVVNLETISLKVPFRGARRFGAEVLSACRQPCVASDETGKSRLVD